MRYLKHIIIALVVTVLSTNTAFAYDIEIDGIYYSINGNSASVVSGGKKYTWDITIPAKITYNDTEIDVTKIGKRAFSYCTFLFQVNIPNSVINIDEEAFMGCTLSRINIPNSVTSIGKRAFRECTSLSQINIPNSVTSIGDAAFEKCTSLSQIDIPSSVTSIGAGAFFCCDSLLEINVERDNPIYSSMDGVLYSKDKTTLTQYPIGKKAKTLDIPDYVTSIGDRAFIGCTSLSQINIPNSVTSIGEMAFSGCTSLSQINIPNSVTSIGGAAFSVCTSLSRINIPNSVTSISNEAFFYCTSLSQINIPNSVTSIGD